jgi:hypothetical protein
MHTTQTVVSARTGIEGAFLAESPEPVMVITLDKGVDDLMLLATVLIGHQVLLALLRLQQTEGATVMPEQHSHVSGPLPVCGVGRQSLDSVLDTATAAQLQTVKVSALVIGLMFHLGTERGIHTQDTALFFLDINPSRTESLSVVPVSWTPGVTDQRRIQ